MRGTHVVKIENESCLVRSLWFYRKGPYASLNLFVLAGLALIHRTEGSEGTWSFRDLLELFALHSNETFASMQLEQLQNLNSVNAFWGKRKSKVGCWLKVHPKIWGLCFSDIVSHSGPLGIWRRRPSQWMLQRNTVVVEGVFAKKLGRDRCKSEEKRRHIMGFLHCNCTSLRLNQFTVGF